MKYVEDKKFIVYKHTNIKNNKVYIGITSKKPKHRWNSGKGYKHNKYLTNSINKYGWSSFKSEIILENLNKDEACKKEIELIKLYKSNNIEFGYNISDGGNLSHLGYKHSDKTKIKMSKNHADFKGEKSTSSIKIICLETLGIFNSIAEAGRKLNIDHRAIHNVLKNKAKSCNNLHFAYLKDYNKNKEYNLSIGNTKPKKIICLETNEVFDSIADASRKLNLIRTSIVNILTGRYKTTGGLHFKYYINGDKMDIQIKNGGIT